jgi:hypothetical protein
VESPGRTGRGRGTYIPSEDPAEKPTLRRFGTFLETGKLESPKKGKMREIGDGDWGFLEKSNNAAKNFDSGTIDTKIPLKEKFTLAKTD